MRGGRVRQRPPVASRMAKSVISLIARSDAACRLLLPVARELLRRRQAYEEVLARGEVERDFPDLRVRHGPFEGLRYPRAVSFHSAIYSKLLGSYEQEIHQAIEQSIARQPVSVVNLGCAEGYYAVGLALRLPAARVFAYDLDLGARRACREMARVNGVAERVHVGSHCDALELLELALGHRAFVPSDCEGWERWILTRRVAHELARHDFLIETHDFIHEGTSELLRARFEESHDVTAIGSVADPQRPDLFRYPEVAGRSREWQERLLAENRPAPTTWLVCRAR